MSHNYTNQHAGISQNYQNSQSILDQKMPTSFDLCEASRLQSIVIKDWVLNLVVQLQKLLQAVFGPIKLTHSGFYLWLFKEMLEWTKPARAVC